MQRIEDVAVPVVGETYLVPSIDGDPVVGTPHVDHDHFQCTPNHWHLDGRFVPLSRARTAIAARGQVPVHAPHVCLFPEPSPWPQGNHGDDYLRRNAVGMVTMALYLGHNARKAVCGVCPHKGMPIHNGVCSGHRLKWLPDGTIAHKPPYTIQIRGTDNKIVLTDFPADGRIEVPITQNHPDNLVLDMFDCEGVLVAWHDMGISRVTVGDRISINPTPGCTA